jgi:hypothetical protein
VSPQPTADCNSPGGLPPGMALGCGLTSVRGNRGENSDNEPLVRQKHIKKKKIYIYIYIHIYIYVYPRNYKVEKCKTNKPYRNPWFNFIQPKKLQYLVRLSL